MASREENVEVDENGRIPGSVFTPRQVRMLRLAVVVMGVLLVAGFGLVIATIAYQASNTAIKEQGAPASAAAPLAADQEPVTIQLQVPAGSDLVSTSLDGNLVALQLSGPAGSEVVVIDLSQQRMVSRIAIQPE